MYSIVFILHYPKYEKKILLIKKSNVYKYMISKSIQRYRKVTDLVNHLFNKTNKTSIVVYAPNNTLIITRTAQSEAILS